jgi:transcriptional regulator with XRE-family HTH domain
MEAKIEEKENILSHNIKYLRKINKFSQEELATKLDIKRSNIAAYESKNVEPRLRIILELARLFNVSVKTLIESKIETGAETPKFADDATQQFGTAQELDVEDNNDVAKFITKSIKIRKVLEGFKSFYTFKKNSITNRTPDKEKLIFDIDNFIQLMEHLLNYNESVIKAISNKNQA